MALVRFTANLARHCDTAELYVAGADVASVLATVFAARPGARGYVLDDQGRLRKHMAVFVDGVQVRDRACLGDAVGPDSTVDLIQALSGG